MTSFETVRSLLQQQHPDLAHLPLSVAGQGWDNTLFRLGDDLAVRVPHRAVAAALIEHEQRWLPVLAPALTLPIPVPIRAGVPGCGLQWPWSITPWFAGEPVLQASPRDLQATAETLGAFVRALHTPAPPEAPRNPWRGVPLSARTSALHEHLEKAADRIDRRAIVALWEHAASRPAWNGPPIWIHGDLHPGNLIVNDGRLSAVIDFGDLTSGDPATDLSVAWMLFPPSTRETFFDAVRSRFDPIDAHTVIRARGWAVALGLAYLSNASTDHALAELGLATIQEALVS